MGRKYFMSIYQGAVSACWHFKDEPVMQIYSYQNNLGTYKQPYLQAYFFQILNMH